MILYGDIEEAPMAEMPNTVDDECYYRMAIAATLLKLTNGGLGGSCSANDKLVEPYLQQEVK